MKKILAISAMLGCAALFAAPDQPGLNRDYWTAAQHKGDKNAKSLVAKKIAPTGSDVQKTSEAKSWTKPEKMQTGRITMYSVCMDSSFPM